MFLKVSKISYPKIMKWEGVPLKGGYDDLEHLDGVADAGRVVVGLAPGDRVQPDDGEEDEGEVDDELEVLAVALDEDVLDIPLCLEQEKVDELVEPVHIFYVRWKVRNWKSVLTVVFDLGDGFEVERSLGPLHLLVVDGYTYKKIN